MFPSIKKDKWKHFFVGLGIGLLLEALTMRFFPQHLWSGSALVLLIIALISYGFELLSLLFKRGHYDLMDAVAGVAGGIMGILLVYAASHLSP